MYSLLLLLMQQIAYTCYGWEADSVLLLLLHHRLVFGGGDVLAPGLLVGEGFDVQ